MKLEEKEKKIDLEKIKNYKTKQYISVYISPIIIKFIFLKKFAGFF